MLQTLPLLPMWAGALVMGLLVFGSILAGFWLGNRHRLRHPDREAGPVGAAAGACLGLLAFLLAFNFGTATSRFENRKSLLLEEANAIHTAWLRADLLEEASAARARALLADYLETRIRVNQDNVDDVIREGEDIQDELWAIAVAALRAGPSARLFAQSVNHLVDVQTERVVHSLQYRTPPLIWAAFLLVAAMAMGSLGYTFGLAGTFRLPVSLALAVAFSAVILLVNDIDRPGEGFIYVDRQPLLDLQARLSPQQARHAASP